MMALRFLSVEILSGISLNSNSKTHLKQGLNQLQYHQ